MLLFISIRIKEQTPGKTCEGETVKWEKIYARASYIHPCDRPRNNSVAASTAVSEVSQTTTLFCQKKPKLRSLASGFCNLFVTASEQLF